MSETGNPAWRAYALALLPILNGMGRDKEVLDDNGDPKLDRKGNPKTERKNLNLDEIRDWAIKCSDALYKAECEAEERRIRAECEESS